MKISYVLPVYNAQNNIAQCIKSLLKQNIKPHEIIIFNDGSTDNTGRVISHIMDSEFSFICFDQPETLGAAVRRNEGNEIATGDIIAVCDADFYMPDNLDRFSSSIHLVFLPTTEYSLLSS